MNTQADPVAVFKEEHVAPLRSIKAGEVLTEAQWEAVCAFVRNQDRIIGELKERIEDTARPRDLRAVSPMRLALDQLRQGLYDDADDTLEAALAADRLAALAPVTGDVCVCGKPVSEHPIMLNSGAIQCDTPACMPK